MSASGAARLSTAPVLWDLYDLGWDFNDMGWDFNDLGWNFSDLE